MAENDLTAIAEHVRALRPLLAMMYRISTEAEREKLRELVPDDGIFHVKNMLSGLCGETAYRMSREYYAGSGKRTS